MVIVSKGSQLDPSDADVQWTGCPWGCEGSTSAFRAVETDMGTFYYQLLYTRSMSGAIELDVRGSAQHALSVYNAQGSRAADVSGSGAQTHKIAKLSHGVYIIRGTIDGRRISSTMCVK
jgi:hypothetical protein